MVRAIDKVHCEEIGDQCKNLGLNTELSVTTSHKGPEESLRIMRQYESVLSNLIFICVAGRSNGLGPISSCNTNYSIMKICKSMFGLVLIYHLLYMLLKF